MALENYYVSPIARTVWWRYTFPQTICRWIKNLRFEEKAAFNFNKLK